MLDIYNIKLLKNNIKLYLTNIKIRCKNER